MKKYDYLILIWNSHYTIESVYGTSDSETYVIPWEHHVPDDIGLIAGVQLGDDNDHWHSNRIDELLAFVHDSIEPLPTGRLFPTALVPDWHHFKLDPTKPHKAKSNMTGSVLLVMAGINHDEWSDRRRDAFVETLKLRAEEKAS
jgi:hypothetical protein